jgi:hypothetical protein
MNLFDKTSNGRYIFNIIFVTLLGITVLFLIVLGIVLLYIRCRRYCQRRDDRLHGYTATNVALNRPPAADIVLGIYNGRDSYIYGDEIFAPESRSNEGTTTSYGGDTTSTNDDRTRFYDGDGWRGFAY